MKLNDKLLNLRKERGLSQQNLADQMNVSRQSISKWELGESEPTLANIIMLSDIFQVSTDYLLKDDQEEKIFEKTKSSSIFLVVGTLIVLLGTLAGYMLWQNDYSPLSLLIGMSIEIIGCIIFAYYALKEQDKKAQKDFLSINIWLLTLLPIKYFSEYTKTYLFIVSFLNRIIDINTIIGTLFFTFLPLLISLGMSLILFLLIRKFF